MQFGKADNIDAINFILPEDHPNTRKVFNESYIGNTDFFVGCAKLNRQELKGFYPRGTKDELSYYAKQFNSIELNATFYKLYSKEQFLKWNQKTNSNFKFYPKLTQDISHYNRLDPKSYPITNNFVNNLSPIINKIGSIFLQLHEDFSPKEYNQLNNFINRWDNSLPLAVELRHSDWFDQTINLERLAKLYLENNISNILTDTAGRRDSLHMYLTNSDVFIRFVGANHPSDYLRLDQWVDRLEIWVNKGIKSISFFVHQNIEIESVILAAYFIKKLNKRLNLNLKVPQTLEDIKNLQQTLF